MALKHISPTEKFAVRRISAAGNADRFCQNILCDRRRVLPCRTDNELWLMCRSYGAIETRHPAKRAEKWRKDSILHDDSTPCHTSYSPQLFLVKNISALLVLVKNLAEQLFLVENLSVVLFW